jgi:uncharacterized protein
MAAGTGNSEQLMQHVRTAGFAYPDDVVHVFVGGSELHGAKVHGTDDLDIYGVYVEPPQIALGLSPLPHFVWSTAGDERRNGPDDVDVTLYSLQRWAELAVKGNPTALHFLFSGISLAGVWETIIEHRQVFLARSAVTQFVGFADNQLKRMTGELGRGKKGQRPEIEQRFGYDVKAAMHTIRLLHECLELLRDKKITLPRPEKELLIRVRTGEFSMERVLALAQQLFRECDLAQRASLLPETVDRAAVSRLVAENYLTHWRKNERRPL